MPGYPDIEPYETGLLDTGDGNLVYWETCGNPDGVPALIVHGGPGSGCTAGNRRSFDPEKFRIIIFDQRNCGRSLPHASDPAADMSLNTTGHLLGDMEQLREMLYSIESTQPFLFVEAVQVRPVSAQAQRDPEYGGLLDVRLDVFGALPRKRG
jgi:proline iminopeptidase